MLYKRYTGSFMRPVFDDHSSLIMSVTEICGSAATHIRKIYSCTCICATRNENQTDNIDSLLHKIVQTTPLLYITRSTEEKICDGTFAEDLTQAMLRDLLYWCIFTDRIDMAKVLLLHIRTRICAALSCAAILRNRLDEATTNDKRNLFKGQAKDFEMYATDCINACYSKSERKACELLIREEPLFGKITCMQVSLYLTVKFEPIKFVGGYFIA
jgi:hypothetical protein